MREQQSRVLLIDGNIDQCRLVENLLHHTHSYLVDAVSNAEQAWEMITGSEQPYQIVLIADPLSPSVGREPELIGIELKDSIQTHCQQTEVLVYTECNMGRTKDSLQATGLYCLGRSLNVEQLVSLVHQTIEYHQLKQTAQKAEQLEALRCTTLAITSLLEQDTLLRTIIQYAMKLLRAKSSGIYKYYPERGELSVIIDFNRPHHVGMTLKVGEGIAGWLVQSDKPFEIVDDYNKWPSKAKIYIDQSPLPAVLEVPLKWQGDFIGVLYIEDDVGRKFTLEDARLLRMFADQAAIALVNAEFIAKDEEKLNRLEKLSQATKEIMSNLTATTLNERLTLIAEHATKILEAEACGIFLVRDEDFLSLEASYGHRDGGFQKGRRLAICSGTNTGMTGHIAYFGKLFNSHGDALLNEPAVSGADISHHTPSGNCYSLLAIPLKKKEEQKEKLIGLLRVDNKKDRDGRPLSTLRFTKEDEWILNIFAEAMAVAIDSIELVEELNKQQDHLARLVASSPNGIIAIDEHGKVTGFNKQAEQILEYKKDEVMHNSVAQLYFDTQEPRRIGKELHLSADGRRTNYETFVKSKDGRAIPISLSATWLYDASNNRIGSVGYFEDLRSIKEKENHLHLLLEASNVITQAKSMKQGLEHLAEMLVLLLTSTFCRILLPGENNQYLVPKAAYLISRLGETFNWDPALEQPIDISDWPGVSQLLEQGSPRVRSYELKEDRLNLIRLSRRLQLEQDIQSMLVVPLKIGDRLIGLLQVGELRNERRICFTKEKIALVSAIGAQITALIDHVQLHEITERHKELLDALDQASRKIRAVKETPKLMQEVVRLATELVGCKVGGLYLNRHPLKQLELSVTHNLPPELMGSQLPHTEGLIGLVIRTTETEVVYNYCNWANREAIFEPYNLKTVIAIPLKSVGEVDGVLFVADNRGDKQFTSTDIDILERFAAQGSIALQTSRLISQGQRRTSQLTILHKISDYIQAADNLDKILHVVLTGITADYGLGFNRAVLLLLDERCECLVGRMGIGQFDQDEARKAWAYDDEQGLLDFAHYLELLESDKVPQTPVGEWVDELQLPVNSDAKDAFSRAVLEQCWIEVKPDNLDQLPKSFRNRFDPTTPLFIIPLMAQGQVIGLLVSDNKFTQSPITYEDVDSLMTFAGTAAIAIHNTKLFQQTLGGREKLISFYKVSSELIALQDPTTLQRAIVEQTLKAADATWVSLIFIDKMGQPQKPITFGDHTYPDDASMIRPNGISMDVRNTGQAFVIEDINKTRDRIHPAMLRGNTKAALCLPMSLPGKCIGVMWIHYDKPHHFSEFEIGALQLYVNQVASASDSARRIGDLERMRNASEALARAADTQEVLKQIVESTLNVLQADSAILWFYDAERDNFILERSIAIGIEGEVWTEFQKSGPTLRGTAYNIMNREWIGIGDIADIQQNQILGPSTKNVLDESRARSFQGMALKVGEENLGVLYAIYNHPYIFEEEERKTALMFANHAALAMEKTKLLGQVKKAKDAAEAVAKVTVLGDRQATLNSIVTETLKAMNCGAVVLFEFDRNTCRLNHPAVMTGVMDIEKALRSEEQTDYQYVYDILNRDEPYIVERVVDNDNFKNNRFSLDEKIQSLVAIPLHAGDEKVGVMFVNYRSPHRFTADELNNIELFANQAAVAIGNAQLFEERSKRLRETEVLLKLSQELLGALNSQEILDHAVAAIDMALSAEFSSIVLPNKKGTLITSAAVGFGKEIIGKHEVPRDSHTGHTINTRVPVVVNNYDEEMRFTVVPIISTYGIKSGLSVPMFKGGDKAGEVIGAMLVQTKNHRPFSEAEVSFLQLLANQTAIALQGAQQYEELKQAKGLVGARTALAYMGMSSSIWHHTIHGHAITIQDYVKHFRSDLKKKDMTAAESRLSEIDGLADKIMSEPITGAPTSDEDVNSVFVNALLQERIKELMKHGSYKSVTPKFNLSLENSATVRVNSDWLNQALDVLVDNAVEAMRDSEEKTLTIGTRSEGGFAYIEIADTGIGMSDDIWSKLLSDRIEKPKESKRMGLGLLMARLIVQVYSGEISKGSTGPTGTTMIVRLPLEK